MDLVQFLDKEIQRAVDLLGGVPHFDETTNLVDTGDSQRTRPT